MQTAKVKQIQRTQKTVIAEIGRQILMFSAGFLLSRTVVMEKFSPLGTAFIAAAPAEYLIVSALGAAAGILTVMGKVSAPLYMISAAIAVCIRFLYEKLKDGSDAAAVCLTAFFAVFVSSTAVTIYTGFNAVEYVMRIFEGIFAASMAYFFSASFEAAKDGMSLALYSERQTTALLISVSALLCGMGNAEIFGISAARTLAAVIILCAARYGGESGGAIGGTAFGIAISLTNPENIFLCGGYSFGGLMAGAFSRLGGFACALAFTVCNGIFGLMSKNPDFAVITVYEILFASVIFLLLPKGVKKTLSAFFSPRVKTPDYNFSKRALYIRLKKASKTLNQIGETVSKVGEVLNEPVKEDFEDVFLQAESSVCSECMLHSYCWEDARSETLSEFLNAAKRLREKDGDILSSEFFSKCARPVKIETALAKGFYEYISKESSRRRVSEVQTAMRLQFRAVSGMLASLGDEINAADSFDRQTAAECEAILRSFSLHPTDVSCRKEKNGRKIIEATVEDGVIPQKKLCERLSAATDRELEIRNIRRDGEKTEISFSDRAVYAVDFSARQYINGKYTVCGDAYESFYDGRGSFFAMLSDGMGSGKGAAIDGAITVGLMSRLICAGFSDDSALSLVNSALLFKSEDESLATLDVMSLDLYTGAVKFSKAGTPPTFVRRGGKMGLAPCSSLPAGILPEIGFEESECTLSEEDIIVMVSDGATADGDEWIKSEIRGFDGSADELAKNIVESAVKRFGAHEDDVTVLVTIVKKAC